MTQSSNRGIFITLEGIDGTGKTTHLRLLVRHLRAQGHTVCETREPGGTRLGERVRDILLATRNRGLTSLAELLLMYADRALHVEKVVRPALAHNEVVVSDRYNDSSLAYQGYGRGLGAETVLALDTIVCGKTQPDLTIVLDLDPRRALWRAQRREKRRRSRRGRFEAQGLKFHERARRGYLALARQEPQRVKVVRADRLAAEVQRQIRGLVDEFLIRAGREKKGKRQR